MTTALFTHAACLDHDTGEGHPECADRLRAVLRALEDEAFQFLDRREAPRATPEQLRRVHSEDHLRAVFDAIPAAGLAMLDADTIVSAGSAEAALRAAGAVCAAVDAVMAGEVRNAFCAVRPPGHHAEPHQPMGFCLFNNVAVAAAHARAVHGLRRIAVVDFDVHHGNGSETLAKGDPDLFYASTHQWPLYPGTGSVRERGPAGNVVNACLRPGSAGPEFRHAVQTQILPVLEAFSPELVLISAGFDAHSRDPLAQLQLSDDDYAWVTARLGGIANLVCRGRMVSALEGGYDLHALATSAAAHVKALMVA